MRLPRRKVTAVVLALAAPALATSALTAPAQAAPTARAASTAVGGWTAKAATVTAGTSVAQKVRIRTGRSFTTRAVVLQRRAAGAQRWAPVVRTRTNPAGKLTLSLAVPRRPGDYQFRLVVPPTKTAARAVTRARTLTARATPSTPTPPPTREQRLRAEVLHLVNQARARARTCGGATYPAQRALVADAALNRAAAGHANDMARRQYFSHNSPEGSTPGDRARAAGYRGGVGENIAAGYPTPQAVMAGWLESAGHCANIMGAGYRVIGIGVAEVSQGYGTYWVQDFG